MSKAKVAIIEEIEAWFEAEIAGLPAEAISKSFVRNFRSYLFELKGLHDNPGQSIISGSQSN